MEKVPGWSCTYKKARGSRIKHINNKSEENPDFDKCAKMSPFQVRVVRTSFKVSGMASDDGNPWTV